MAENVNILARTPTVMKYILAALVVVVVAGVAYHFLKAPRCPVWIQRDSAGVCWYVPGDGTKTKLPSCPPGC